MKTTLKCITLWAAFAASYVAADAAVKVPAAKNWSASASLDATGNIMGVTYRRLSADGPERWSKTSGKGRRFQPGMTLQAKIKPGLKNLYLGAEVSGRLGNIKSNSEFYQVTGTDRLISNHRKMSDFVNVGLLLGWSFGDLDVNVKGGIARASVRHYSGVTHGDTSDLAYKKSTNGYYIGVGVEKQLLGNWYAGLDYEFASYKQEQKRFTNSAAALAYRNKGYQKAQAHIDTLKLRLIYKI